MSILKMVEFTGKSVGTDFGEIKVMDKAKKKKIMNQIRRERKARRDAAKAEGLAKIHSTVHLTTKKDQQDKESNTVREIDLDH